MAKLKDLPWHKLPRNERSAAVLYPNQAEETRRREMAALAKNERKQAPRQEKLLSDKERGPVSPLGGLAK
jgi:hypothetical protein